MSNLYNTFMGYAFDDSIVPIVKKPEDVVSSGEMADAINDALGAISIVDNGDMTYSLMVDNQEAGKISTVETLSQADYQGGMLNLKFATSEGDKDFTVDLSELIDIYKSGRGINVNEDGEVSTIFNIDDYATKSELHEPYNDADLKDRISALEDAAATYQPKGEYLTEHQSLDEYLKSADAAEAYQPKGEYLTEHQDVSDCVRYTSIGEGRKEILFENHDVIFGKATDSHDKFVAIPNNGQTTLMVGMVSKWNVVDMGSNHAPFNINVANGFDYYDESGAVQHNDRNRPTVNDKEEIAYVSDVDSLREALNAALERIEALEQQIASIGV